MWVESTKHAGFDHVRMRVLREIAEAQAIKPIPELAHGRELLSRSLEDWSGWIVSTETRQSKTGLPGLRSPRVLHWIGHCWNSDLMVEERSDLLAGLGGRSDRPIWVVLVLPRQEKDRSMIGCGEIRQFDVPTYRDLDVSWICKGCAADAVRWSAPPNAVSQFPDPLWCRVMGSAVWRDGIRALDASFPCAGYRPPLSAPKSATVPSGDEGGTLPLFTPAGGQR